MKFGARNYENILLDYCFIRAIGVQLNIKSVDSQLSQIQGVFLKFIEH